MYSCLLLNCLTITFAGEQSRVLESFLSVGMYNDSACLSDMLERRCNALHYRSLGKALFMDEDRLQVPFLAGSMADSAFVSASSPSGTPTGDCW